MLNVVRWLELYKFLLEYLAVLKPIALLIEDVRDLLVPLFLNAILHEFPSQVTEGDQLFFILELKDVDKIRKLCANLIRSLILKVFRLPNEVAFDVSLHTYKLSLFLHDFTQQRAKVVTTLLDDPHQLLDISAQLCLPAFDKMANNLSNHKRVNALG